MSSAHPAPYKYVMYLAVLPKYRTECIGILRQRLGDDLGIYVSNAHLDDSVQTGIPRDFYREVSIYRLLGRQAFVQVGSLGAALRAQTAVIDLNPRSLTAWAIVSIRFILRKRTLVWGHIHPQAGPAAKTAGLRLFMRRMASGTISYTYRDAEKAVQDLPGAPIWTAPNSLYRRDAITPAVPSASKARADVLYVGRFAPEKKVALLMEGFALASKQVDDMRLNLIGGGAQEAELRALAAELGVADKVSFPGWIDDLNLLRPYYSSAFCSASPGFAGLGLTQSLGFGVPMVVAKNEPHSPEIELDASGGVQYFDSNSPASLSVAILERWNARKLVPDAELSTYTRHRYSAEAMADGLESALANRPRRIQIAGA